jgi:membrane-bound metal-dependent hydrolase YbcI (DUF457 family)
MFLGHFGVGFAAKKPAPQVSLGTFFLAAQWADLLWPILLILKLEHVTINPGDTISTPLNFDHYPYTHSLVFQLGWSLLLALVYFAFRKNLKNAVIVGLLVVSHWVLDFLVHRPDLPILPNGPFVGLGLWNNLTVTLILECVFFFGGVFIYYKTTKPKDRIGKYALLVLVIFLSVSYVLAIFGPPPPNESMLEYTSLTLWLLIPWSYWIDRHRTVNIL